MEFKFYTFYILFIRELQNNECNISYSNCLSRFQAGYGSLHPVI